MSNRTETFKQSLKVELEPEEKIALGAELAELQQEKAKLEAEQKNVKKQFDSKIAQCDSRGTEIGCLIRSGYEYRSVECERTFDYPNAEVVVVRLDTNEVVEKRGMTKDELQIEMPLEDGPVTEDYSEEPPEGAEPQEDKPEPPQEEVDENGWNEDVQALVAHLRATKRCSINNVRRATKWGYEKANRVMEQAEALGIIGPPKGPNPREILIDLDEPEPANDEPATEEGTEEDV